MNTLESIFSDYCKVSQKVQLFETKLKSEDVSSEMRPALHTELEEIHTELESTLKMAEGTNSTVASQLAKMNDQIVSLYGQIEDRFENYEVSLIAREALDLGALLEQGQMTRVAAMADKLKGHIQFLFSQRRPSLQNHKIIDIAEKLANQASAPQGTRGKLYSIQLIGILKILIEEAIERTERVLFPDEAELALELYEVADLFSHHYEADALHRLRQFLHRLPERAEKCLEQGLSAEARAQILMEIAHEITHGNDSALVESRA